MGALPTPLTPALASRESRVSGGERRCSSSRMMVRRERPGGIRQGRCTALLPQTEPNEERDPLNCSHKSSKGVGSAREIF
jgi:hypothetical protein